MSVGSNREGTRADSDLGVGLTDSAPSPYSRAAVSIGARRCAPLRFEIIEDERTADDTGSAQDDTSSREMIGALKFLLALADYMCRYRTMGCYPPQAPSAVPLRSTQG